MKLFDMGTTAKKTESTGKLAEELKKKKKPNPPGAAWSEPAAPTGDADGSKENEASAGEEAPAARRPSYGEVMGQYYADRYADELAGNRRTAEAAAESAERDAQNALRRIRGGYNSTDRQLYREYMESCRTLPQRLAAQGITGGLAESSQVRLANSYGEELAENERARLSEEAETFSRRDSRLAAAKTEQDRADAEAKKTHGENLTRLWQEVEKQRRENAAKTAALLAAAGDYSGYLDLGLTQEQADYLAEVWMGKNGKVAGLRRAWNGAGGASSGPTLGDTLSQTLLLNAENGTDAAVEYIAAQLAAGELSNDEAEEIWKLLRASGAGSDGESI